jgi:hypothetical protein
VKNLERVYLIDPVADSLISIKRSCIRQLVQVERVLFQVQEQVPNSMSLVILIMRCVRLELISGFLTLATQPYSAGKWVWLEQDRFGVWWLIGLFGGLEMECVTVIEDWHCNGTTGDPEISYVSFWAIVDPARKLSIATL